ncbi:hypothetical protein PybrP1_012197 [[Pythium] brassicae (nom. inval.)]|nr:hypothetical protein PybrP1_012197 [[Pythium] brassicae (nom. inval.)]
MMRTEDELRVRGVWSDCRRRADQCEVVPELTRRSQRDLERESERARENTENMRVCTSQLAWYRDEVSQLFPPDIFFQTWMWQQPGRQRGGRARGGQNAVLLLLLLQRVNALDRKPPLTLGLMGAAVPARMAPLSRTLH